MTAQGKRVSVFDIAKGAIGYLPDVPQIIPSLASLALLRPHARKSMGLLFQETARKYAKRTFLKSGTESWTYQHANLICNQMARGLLAMGVKAGDTVGLLSANHADTLLAVIACAKLGAVAAMLNINQRGEVQAHSLSLVKPKLLLACSQGLEIVSQMLASYPGALDGVEILSLETESATLRVSDFKSAWCTQPSHNLAQTPQIAASSPCFYIFTSGTTGLPKASVMSHYRWLQASQGMSTAVRLNSSDVFYCCLPLYHNNALTVSLGVVLASGACFALDEKFSASQFWQRIVHYKATAFCYIGELLRYLMNQPEHMSDQNHEIRLILGNGLRPEIWNDFEDRFGIHHIFEFYGASESNLGFMNAFGLKETVGFCPLPFEVVACNADTEQVVRNRQGYCESVERGEIGLLISEVTELRPFDGYTDPKANEGKLLRNVFKKGDCWFNSGDLVRRQGWQHIQFVDRLGDTFRWKGENVATSEVEGALAKLPFLEHAVVYGVKIDGADGRAGMAAVAVKSGHHLDMNALAAALVANLPTYAVPQFVRVLNAVETTGTFKYQKVQLKKDGANPAAFSDPLYQFDTKRKTYYSIN
ncbi:long-chain-acyl-CoA synthetase [Limnobacter parvus]|uniref:Long-chain-acyl-CoA synthetase n=1 Tax=Limnobacter parvus TaxID=2939690 RepID=A0ABT1XHA6_9BURK|nr:long-chain-acyl-CoA synthetase [Limnobacter parvus]MCR2746662.1 long-chain-acyl-CoA synthetase [Limnobacter parvus]